MGHLYATILASLERGWSVIPLLGGADPSVGKRPALSWSAYQDRLPTLDEVQAWFAAQGYTAYGIVCGHVSSLIVLDIDRLEILTALQTRLPHLLETFTVRSGTRGTPHLYFRVDFPVKTQKLLGADLKAEGGYVVGPGSIMGEAAWTVERNLPVRRLTRAELNSLVTVLAPAPTSPHTQVANYYHYPSLAERQTSTPRPTQSAERGPLIVKHGQLPPTKVPLSPMILVNLYQHKVAQTGQRNNSLFQVACFARDHGFILNETLYYLVYVHAQEPARHGQRDEPLPQRVREAQRTIASAYTRPRRKTETHEVEADPRPASYIPTSLREALLKRPENDGMALLRVLEGLQLQGLQAGDVFTLQSAETLLAGLVGRHSIMKALKIEISDGNRIFKPFVRSCPGNKKHFCSSQRERIFLSAPAGEVQEGTPTPHRPSQSYVYPNVFELCEQLGIYAFGHAPIRLEDIHSPRRYREALEKELIERRPGSYYQHWLAQRIGVTSRTIRRYHKSLGVKSRAKYFEFTIHWDTLLRLLSISDGPMPGCYLMDEKGKRYPAQREIAHKLLGQKHRLVLRIRSTNLYWLGDEPVWTAAQLGSLGFEKRLASQITQPAPSLVLPAVPGNSTPVAPQSAVVSDEMMVYICSQDPKPQQLAFRPAPATRLGPPEIPKRSDRFYRRPLPDVLDEALVQYVHEVIPKLSQPNIRRLIDLYGADHVRKTLKRAQWMQERGKLNEPAAFMVTATQVSWRVQYGFGGVVKPEFHAQPKRRPRQRNKNKTKTNSPPE